MARTAPIGFARLIQFLVELVRGRFNGSVQILFRDGVIATVKREETWIEHQQLPVQDLEAVRVMETGRAHVTVPLST